MEKVSESLLAAVNGLDHLTALVFVDVVAVHLGERVENLGPLLLLEHDRVILLHGGAHLLHEHLAFRNLVNTVTVAIHQLPQLIQLFDCILSLEAIETSEMLIEVSHARALNCLSRLFAGHFSLSRKRSAVDTSVATHGNSRRNAVVDF